MFFFSCKAYEEFRRDLQWFDGIHTAAATDVSNVMSVDDQMSIRELSRFFVLLCFLQSFAKENDTATSQSST